MRSIAVPSTCHSTSFLCESILLNLQSRAHDLSVVSNRYWEALQTFYNMAHSSEFQVQIKLRQHQLLFVNNWRTLHGRAGLKGKARTILGGTVSREGFYSRMRKVVQEELQIPHEVATGIPTHALRYLTK